jgi:hypothetical protein
VTAWGRHPRETGPQRGCATAVPRLAQVRLTQLWIVARVTPSTSASWLGLAPRSYSSRTSRRVSRSSSAHPARRRASSSSLASSSALNTNGWFAAGRPGPSAAIKDLDVIVKELYASPTAKKGGAPGEEGPPYGPREEVLVSENHANGDNGQSGYDEGFDAGYAAAWQDVTWPLVARVARHGNPEELAHLTGKAIAIGESHQMPLPTVARDLGDER